MSPFSARAEIPSLVTKKAPLFAFFFLHVCFAWPTGVVGLALGSSLARAGVPVHSVSAIVAAASLAFTFEFVWAPIVDASLTRRAWFVIGAVVMGTCLFAMLVLPWNAGAVPILTLLAFASCSGAGICGVATKGIMAYDVAAPRLGAASGFYTAGGTFAKAVGAAATLLLLTHLSSRPLAAGISVATALLAGTFIMLASPAPAASLRAAPAKIAAALLELFNFIRTRNGMLVALLCVIPFGAGTEAGLMGAISREWRVSADQLALFSTFGVATNIASAIASGWLATHIGPWRIYIALGLTMIAAMILFAFAPRTAMVFISMELFYRALGTGCYAALLGIVMTAIGRGAASTKAAGLWSLANFAYFYPALIEGAVHDRGGTAAMLLTDAGLGTAGLAVLLVAILALRPRTVDEGPAVLPLAGV
jgi:hypothetical protein